MSDEVPVDPPRETPILDDEVAGQGTLQDFDIPAGEVAPRRSGSTSRPGKLARVIVPTIALATLAIVAFVFDQVRDPAPSGPVQQAGPSPPPGPRALPDSSQPGGPVASLLSIAGSSSSAVVGLGAARYHDSTPDQVDESIMAHEVVRQAVLLAARDLGAVVRDESIGDPLPVGVPLGELEVGSHFAMDRVPLAVLARRGPEGRVVLATFELGGPMPKFIDYPTLLEHAEALSRSEVGFRKVLRAGGLMAAPPAPPRGNRPAEEIEQRLARLTFTEPFAAIRLLHAEIRDRGESPARLGALARGYTNLGALIDFHWSGAAKACKARALLIAQRMVALEPRSPEALRHRAYARSMIGFHKDALSDLDGAAKLASSGPVGERPPGWVALVDALCRFQTGKLVAAGAGPDEQLAMFLAFLTAEWPTTGSTGAIGLGRDLVRANPECYRVFDSLGRFVGVSNGHWATSAALGAFNEAIPGRLRDMPGLPPSVASRLRDGADEATVERALFDAARDAGDRGEPSWGALGRLVMDARFALLLRRAQFMRWTWNVPTAEFVAATRPLVADHPYLPLLDSFAVDPSADPAGYAELIRRVEIPDLDFVEGRFVGLVSRTDFERHKRLVAKMICHGDTFYQDLVLLSRWIKKEAKLEVARNIERTSPFAPMARAMLIDDDWARVEPRAKEWEAEAIAGGRPEILMNLGGRYLELKHWDDAERCLAKAIEMTPDIEGFKLLAKVYQGRGELERWKATLERALEADDPGLDHMTIRVQLANYYMGLKEYDKALPYAESAAATWAGAGMQSAAYCHESMGHWDQAELWVRRSTERYPETDWMSWFVWCRRTGRGDLAAARAFAVAFMKGFGDRPTVGRCDAIGRFYIVDGSPKEALSVLVPLQDKLPDPIRGLMIASQAEAMDDTESRDRALAGIAAIPETGPLKLAGCINSIRAILGGEKPDTDALLATMREIPTQARYTVALFVGLLLHGHDADEIARSLLYRSYEMSGEGWVQAMASVIVKEWEKAAPNPADSK